jgi:eukaryotic-like serine/threonine-protein kinase
MSQVNRPRAFRPEESGQVSALEGRDLSLSEALGKYRLLGALGHGGMADVYLAVADGPEGFRKLCVLKLLKESMAQDDDFRVMFLDEARLAARLNHPTIVQTFEVGELDGRLMLAMEYVEGQPVTRVRRRLSNTQFPLTAYIRVLCDILDALEYAHGLTDFDGSTLGIVHRDVSPHNIIVGYDARAKLVDFGIAKSSASEQATQAGVLKGKVGYMAPEQATLGAVDGRADVFSVGVVLWEAIAGRRLAEGMMSNDVLLRRASGNDPKIIEVVPNVDPELAAICDCAMARSPADRFPTAADFQTELERWLQQRTEPSRKEWSKALREAFAPEREQVRAIVEHSMSALQHSGMIASYSKLLSSGEYSSLTPPKGPQLSSSMRQLGGVSSNANADADGNPGTQLAAGAPVEAVPSRPRTSMPLVLGVASAVALGVGAIAYVAGSRTPTPRPAGPPAEITSHAPAPASPEAKAAPSTSESAAVLSLPSASASSVASTSTSSSSVSSPNRPKLPPAVPAVHQGHARPTPPSPPATSAASPPATPAPTKPATRSLDEKDPYAP